MINLDVKHMKNLTQIQKNNDMSFEELLKNEIFKSERLRAFILIGLLSIEAIALLFIYLIYKDEYHRMFESQVALYAIFIFAAILIIYELLIHLLISKKIKVFFLNRKFFGYFSSFSEISLLSLLLIFIVEYSNQITILQTPATLTYFIFIVLSTLRLDFKLSVFTGLLAALQYILITVYYSYTLEPLYNGPARIQYFGQGLIMVIVGIAAGFVADLIRKKMIISWNNIKAKNEVIDLFGQQISSQIAENILENHNELTGTRKQVCVMFLDIREFTPFVERNQPEAVVAYLNTLFGFMIDIVQSNHGVINQFLGDGFMATFGAPVALDNSSQSAVKASIKILEKVSEEAGKGNIPETRLGIGLHYDEAITGNIGSSVRKQYSITGKVVIMASRIEQLNKTYHTQLLISEEVFNQLSSDVQSVFMVLGSSRIKGSEKLISIYKLNKDAD